MVLEAVLIALMVLWAGVADDQWRRREGGGAPAEHRHC